MATRVEAEVVVTQTAESPPPEQREGGEDPPTEKEKKGLFRRFSKKEKGEKSKKPPGNKWLQQQIPACRPVFTAKHVFAVLLIIGLIFIGLGILFLVLALGLDEVQVEYTNCSSIDPTVWNGSCEDYLESLANRSNIERVGYPECQCQVNFTVPRVLQRPWYVYYSLHNYYQNHRRYLNSWDPGQLRGSGLTTPSSNCRPLQNSPDINGTEKSVFPCGLVANSWFNDSFYSWNRTDSSDTSLDCCDRTGIAWGTDLNTRFQNPEPDPDTITENELGDTIMPPFWLRNLAELPNNPNISSAGLRNESLIVWFRVSAFPWFRKLYGRVRVNGNLDGELPAGNYSVTLTYNYPVRAFNGRKFLLLSEVSWFGGRNLFLGSAYLATGIIAVIAGIVLLLVHLLCSRWKVNDKGFLNRKY